MAQQPVDEPQASAAELREQIRGKWQIPLLILGVGCFVVAVLLLVYPSEPKINGETLLRQARVAFLAEDFGSTIRFCEKFRTNHPRHTSAGVVHELHGDASYQLSLAELDNELDFLAKAQISYRDALEFRPQDIPSPQILFKLGQVHERLGEFLEAASYYGRALENKLEGRLSIRRARIRALRAVQPKPLLDDALAEVAEIHKELGDGVADQQRQEIALIESDLLNAKGEYAKAEAILRSAGGRKIPKKFLLALAETQRLAGRHTDAIDTLNEALARKPADEQLDVQAFFMQGRVHYDMKHFEHALTWYGRTSNEYPATGEALAARLGIAETYLALGESLRASEVYASIAPELRKLRSGQNPWIDLNHARRILQDQRKIALLQGRLEDALKFVMLEESILRSPDEEVLEHKAQILSRVATLAAAKAVDPKLGDGARKQERLQAERAWQEAGDLYLRLAEEYHGQTRKEYPTDNWLAAKCFILAGAHERSAEVLERFTREQPRDSRVPEALLELARQYEVLGKWDEAIKALQTLRARSGSSLAGFEGLYRLGNSFTRKGPEFYDQAEEAFRSLTEDSNKIEPESLWYRNSLMQLGRLMFRRKDYDRAIITLNEYLQRYPNSPDTKSASYLVASSVRKQGLRALEKSAKTIRPVDRDAFVEIHRQKLQSAADQFKLLVPIYEQMPQDEMTSLGRQEYQDILFALADSLYELDRFEEAVKIYNVIVYQFQMDPCAMAAYVKLATAYQKMGHWDKAKAVFERAHWTLEKIPEGAFASRLGEPSKPYWENWIQVMQRD